MDHFLLGVVALLATQKAACSELAPQTWTFSYSSSNVAPQWTEPGACRRRGEVAWIELPRR